MNVEYARTLIDYHIDANTHLWECIMHLSEAQFVQPCDYSYGSVQQHVVHMMSADIRWLARAAGTPPPARLNAEDYPTRASARARQDEVTAAFQAFGSALDDRLLAREVAVDLPHRGVQKVNLGWQILAHVVNHGTDHRAQVLRLLHDMGAPTFEQDLIIYLWNQA